MSNPYAGDPDNYPDTIPVIDDGDPPVAATWAPAYEGLADRTAWIRARMFGEPSVGDQAIVLLPTFLALRVGDPDEWSPHVADNVGIGWLQTGITGLGLLYWSLPHFPGMRLNNVDVHFNTQTGRAGLPATQPKIILQRAIAPALLSSAPDYEEIATNQLAAGNVGDYEDRFALSLALGAADTDFRVEDPMFLGFLGESGANAQADLLFLERIALVIEPA